MCGFGGCGNDSFIWVILLLLLAEMLILERKNPLFRNIHLFSNKK